MARSRRPPPPIAATRTSTPLLALLVIISLISTTSCRAQQQQRSSWNWSFGGSSSSSSDDKKKRQKTTTHFLANAETLIEDVVEAESDPVAKRERHFMHSCKIGFESITMTFKPKTKNGTPRLILDGSIKGEAKPGRMLAIMGPSGSGKTTLLHALAGRIKSNKRIKLQGRRYVNDSLISGDSIIPSAFIEQESNFFPHMTVKETLDFRVELKLGKKLGKDARDDIVYDLMDSLGLVKSANTPVGNRKVRGISGGERKRLSIACEMISSPSLIFLDEPTSGLDSYQADQVVKTMRKLADEGKTIVAVIHQPSQRVFSYFDDLLLISEGRQMYYGKADEARGYFEALGCQAIKDVGSAEHVIDCISAPVGTNGNGEGVKIHESLDRMAKEARARGESLVIGSDALEMSDDDEEEEEGITSNNNKKKGMKLHRFHGLNQKRPTANVFQQFRLLLVRSLQDVFRGKGALIIKVVQQVTIAFIYGGIYHLGNNQASIMDRMGLLSLIAIGSSNMGVASTIRSFPKEKTIISSEISSQHLYSTLPYFVAKAIAEFPPVAAYSAIFGCILYPLVGLQKNRFANFLGITTMNSIVSLSSGLLLGSVAANEDVALAMFPAILVISIIFDGKNISIENTPRLLRWVPKVGLIRWAFEGLAINEFTGLTFENPRGSSFRGPPTTTGEEALERFNLGGVTLGDTIKAQGYIVAGCWLLSFLGLSAGRDKFQVMESP